MALACVSALLVSVVPPIAVGQESTRLVIDRAPVVPSNDPTPQFTLHVEGPTERHNGLGCTLDGEFFPCGEGPFTVLNVTLGSLQEGRHLLVVESLCADADCGPSRASPLRGLST